MRKINLKSSLATTSVWAMVAGSSLAIAAPVVALSSTEDSSVHPSVDNRLDQAKLRVCKVRHDSIEGILRRTALRGDRHLTVIGNIATRTEAFYTKSGKTLSN